MDFYDFYGELLNKNTLVQKLDFSEQHFDWKVELNPNSSLKELNLSKLRKEPFEFDLVFKSLSNIQLRSLDISSNINSSFETFSRLNFESLEFLKVNSSYLGESGMNCIANAPNIIQLHLNSKLELSAFNFLFR